MRQLDRYIARNVLGATLLVLVVLVCLEGLFAFLTQLESVTDTYGSLDALIYTVLMMPKKLYEMIPVSSLVGCLMGLGSMAANSELVVMRAAGVSLWRILYAVIRPAFVMIIAGLLLGEYVAPITEQLAGTQRAIARSANGVYSGEGLWHREGDEYMYFNAVEPNGVLHGITRYHFDENKQLQESSVSKRAIYQGDHWILEDVTLLKRINKNEFTTKHLPTMVWQAQLDTNLLSVVVMKPESLAITGLMAYTDYLKDQELDAGEYSLALWTKLLQPLSILSLVLVGISFVFGPLRSVSMGLRLFSGVITGVIFMIVQNLMGPMSLVFGFPPILSVLLPIVVCLCVGGLLLRKAA